MTAPVTFVQHGQTARGNLVPTTHNILLSFTVLSCYLGEGVRLGPPGSIDRGPDSASHVFSGGPDACVLVLLVHLSLDYMATELDSPKCGDRQFADAHVRRNGGSVLALLSRSFSNANERFFRAMPQCIGKWIFLS